MGVRMRKIGLITKTLAVAALVAVCIPNAANALLDEYPDGPVSSPAWPEGWASLISQDSRVYGYFLNQSDCFYFAGDTAQCNSFLADYAALLRRSEVVFLAQGPGVVTKQFKDERVAFDWELSIGGSSSILLTIHPGGKVKLGELRVPLDLQVQALSSLEHVALDENHSRMAEETWREESSEFMASHAARRQSAGKRGR